MAIKAGNFFPPEYRQCPFEEGDLLVIHDQHTGRFAINKILRVDRIEVKQGESIAILDQRFTAPEDDYLLVVGFSVGVPEFETEEAARAATLAGTWNIRIGHVPIRSPGIAHGHVRVGNAPVTEEELDGYRMWRQEFDQGKAGIF
ncbi:MAG: hypothetical protein ACKO3P_21750 [Planctomycetaceae bacterium]